MLAVKTENETFVRPSDYILHETKHLIKKKIKQEESNWFLYGVSEAAKKKPPVCLRIGENKVGKSSAENLIVIRSNACSRQHCTLTVSEHEVIMRDNSRNGTYVNSVAYVKSRQILCHEDIIGFGACLEKNDAKNPSYIYQLKLCDSKIFDVITIDDDNDTHKEFDDLEVDDIKNVPRQPTLKFDGVIELDSDEEDIADDVQSRICNENDIESEIESMSGIYDDDDTILTEEDASTECEDQPTAERIPLPSELQTPNLDIPLFLRSEIKQEVNWMSIEYDRDVAVSHGESLYDENDICIIELTDSDEEEDYVPPSLVEPSSPKAKKQKSNEKEGHTVLQSNQDTHDNQTSSPESLPLSRPISRPKVKICSESRAERLAKDMLGIMDAVPSTSVPTKPVRRPLAKARPHAFPLAKQKNGSDSSDSEAEVPTATEEQLKLPSPPSWSNQNILHEITRWDAQWLTNEFKMPPFLSKNFDYKRAPEAFESLQSYQSSMVAFLKLELWHAVLSESKNKRKSIFSHLNSFSLKKCDSGLHRYIYKCEACEFSDKEPLCSGDFVLVTHGKGRFFAYVRDVDTLSNKLFVLEGATVGIKSKILKTIKYISVRVMLNLKLDQQYFFELANLSRSKLCLNLIQPSKNKLAEILPSQFNYQGFEALDEQQLSVLQSASEQVMYSIEQQRPIIETIAGPSGTGKTRLIVNMILHMLNSSRLNFLVCAASNQTVDRITVQLLQFMELMDVSPKLVRFGISDNMVSDVQNVAIECYTKDPSEIKRLKDANVVCTTLGGTINLYQLTARKFDVCIVDDASTSAEPAIFPALRCSQNTMVMFGDSDQRVPSIISPINRRYGLKSLFDRLQPNHRLRNLYK